uniref:FAD/NAD(P)-binding domain-containing protein n=1 Tax=Lactuca sativa TaxID=4236 RepID=A0A9R1VJ82_LACSA|nr:hypothetical protein LSAT_V11C500261520 [Lactuca sativa]
MIYAGKTEADLIVIGGGTGGLYCAGILARYGKHVIVLEKHDLPEEKHMNMLIRKQRIQDGIEDVNKAATKAFPNKGKMVKTTHKHSPSAMRATSKLVHENKAKNYEPDLCKSCYFDLL